MLYILDGNPAERLAIQAQLSRQAGAILVGPALLRDVDRLLDCGATLMLQAEDLPDAAWAIDRGGCWLTDRADLAAARGLRPGS